MMKRLGYDYQSDHFLVLLICVEATMIDSDIDMHLNF